MTPGLSLGTENIGFLTVNIFGLCCGAGLYRLNITFNLSV